MDVPNSVIPENRMADAKDRLREEGIVIGPDRYGNWFVPCGKSRIAEWKPGDDIEDRVMVRNNGALDHQPIHWDWLSGHWQEGEMPMPDVPLPFIY